MLRTRKTFPRRQLLTSSRSDKVVRSKIISKMWNTFRVVLVVVTNYPSHGISCQICPSHTVMEGDSVTIDCGLQTTIDGGNLMWQIISTDSVTSIGHVVPGDHVCGTDTIDCTLHTNGSITLLNATVGDGDKCYRCLRGDREGYHYFSDFKLTVLRQESMGHPVIQPLTGSKANVYTIGKMGVIHSYYQPTCKDDEDGDLIVTCYPPSGVIVNKVYDQVNCGCTDLDWNSNSLNITVNKTSGHPVIIMVTPWTPKSYTIGEKSVIHSYYQPTCKDDEDGDLRVDCYPPSGVIVNKVYDQVHCNCTDSDGNSNSLSIAVNSHTELNENSIAASVILGGICLVLAVSNVVFCVAFCHQKRNAKISRCCASRLGKGDKKQINVSSTVQDAEVPLTSHWSQRLTEMETKCREKSEEIDKLTEMNQKKDTDISDLRHRLTEKEADCADESEKIKKLKEIIRSKDMDIHLLIQRLRGTDGDYDEVKEKESEENNKHSLLQKWKIFDVEENPALVVLS